MPLPNQAAASGLPLLDLQHLTFPSYFDKDKFYNLILKFDWNFGNKHRAFFRHASNDRTEDRAVNGIDNKPGTDGQQPFQRINDAYVADWVGTVSPTLILERARVLQPVHRKGLRRRQRGLRHDQPGNFVLADFASCRARTRSTSACGTSRTINSLGRSQSNNYTNTYQCDVQRHQGCRHRTPSRPVSTSARSTTSSRTPATS